MDVMIVFTLMLITAVSVGVSVSLDVSGFNLSMAGDKEYSSQPIIRSLQHATWHGLFLALGIGVVHVLGTTMMSIMVNYDLAWMFSWLTGFFSWLEIRLVPTWLLAVLAIGLWVMLYWSKIRGDGDESIPAWLKWVLKSARVPVTQLMYVAVAVDMWFLTPLLKTVVELYTTAGKIGFIVIVFATVFTCSMLSIKYGQKFLASKNRQLLFFWSVSFVVLEPIITGYFAARIGWWSLFGEYTDSVGLLFAAVICTGLLCLGKFQGIVERKWQESGDSVGTDHSEPLPEPKA